MRSLLAVTSSVLLIVAFAASVAEAQSSSTSGPKFNLIGNESIRFEKHIQEIKNLMLNHSNEYYIVTTEFKTANPEAIFAEGEIPGNMEKEQASVIQKSNMNVKLNEMKKKLEDLAIAKVKNAPRTRRFADDTTALQEAEELMARANILKFFADNFDFSVEITPN